MKRRKTMITTLLAIFLIAATTFTLTACGHVHEYDEKWTTDATNHWHVCTGDDCKEVSDKAAHTFVDKNSDTQYWLECSVCGYQQDKIDAKVTDEQLKNAIQFKDAEGKAYNNFQAEKFDNLSNKVTRKVKFTGDGYYRYQEETNEALEGIYVNFDNDGVKTYAKYERNDLNDDWTKKTGSGSYTTLHSTARNQIILYKGSEAFEYKAADNIYSATTATATNKNTTYSLKFANGKLVSVRIVTITTNPTTSETSTTEDVTWTISYGNATIELPTVDVAE